jgi:hypothetical protein
VIVRKGRRKTTDNADKRRKKRRIEKETRSPGNNIRKGKGRRDDLYSFLD